jgi:hypothetical protein
VKGNSIIIMVWSWSCNLLKCKHPSLLRQGCGKIILFPLSLDYFSYDNLPSVQNTQRKEITATNRGKCRQTFNRPLWRALRIFRGEIQNTRLTIWRQIGKMRKNIDASKSPRFLAENTEASYNVTISNFILNDYNKHLLHQPGYGATPYSPKDKNSLT